MRVLGLSPAVMRRSPARGTASPRLDGRRGSEAAWFGGAKRVAEPGCERSERRIRARREAAARTPRVSSGEAERKL